MTDREIIIKLERSALSKMLDVPGSVADKRRLVHGEIARQLGVNIKTVQNARGGGSWGLGKSTSRLLRNYYQKQEGDNER